MSKLSPDGSPHPTLKQFAADNGITYETAKRLVSHHRIFGAYQHPRSKRWYVGPPAKIIEGD